MAASSLVPVQFHGATLVTTTIDGVPFVAIKPICESIGLDWKSQYARIKRHPVLSTCVVVTTMQISGDDQARDMFMLPLEKLNGWLFGVSVRRVKPELRERLTQYQSDCFDVLARHFGAGVPRQDIQSAASTSSIEGPSIKHHSAKQCEAAVQAGGVASFQVQMALARAVLDGGDDWMHQRWLISFITDSERGAPPVVERLLPDTMVLKKSELINLMANVTADAWTEMKKKLAQQDI